MRPPQLLPLLLSLSLVAVPYAAQAQTIEQLFEAGRAAYSAGRYEEAEAIWRQVIEQEPENAEAYTELGNALDDQGDAEGAIAAYQRAIELDSNNDAYAYTNLGNALRDQGDVEGAIAAHRRAIEIAPDFAGAYANLGNVLRDQEKLEEATGLYRQALALPNKQGDSTNAHTQAYNGLGNVLQQQGKLEEAIIAYQQAIELDPDFAMARNNLREAQRLLALQIEQPPEVDDRQFLPSERDEPLLPVLRSTARIIAQVSEGNLIGAGWGVKRQGNTVWVVTNRHVVSDERTREVSQKVEIEFFSELEDARRPRYEAVVEQVTEPDGELDLAVLRIEGVPDDIEPLQMQPGRLSRQTPVRLVGHPYTVAEPWATTSGEVISYSPNSQTLPIDALVAQGNSGGPVINAASEVVGMMVQIRNEEDIAVNPDQITPILNETRSTGGVGVAYRIEIVLEVLREWGVLD